MCPINSAFDFIYSHLTIWPVFLPTKHSNHILQFFTHFPTFNIFGQIFVGWEILAESARNLFDLTGLQQLLHQNSGTEMPIQKLILSKMSVPVRHFHSQTWSFCFPKSVVCFHPSAFPLPVKRDEQDHWKTTQNP